MTYHVPAVLAAPPLALPPPSDVAAKIVAVAEALQPVLAAGQAIDTGLLRAKMERAFGGSDAAGAWDWKLAYEAGEAALVLFLRKFGRALLARVGSPAAMLPILAKVAGFLPTHTRRSEEMERYQQFSTPLPMGLAALAAAQITPRDVVLDPSAGTGLLAVLAEISGGSLALNELAQTRADLLRRLFPGRTGDFMLVDTHQALFPARAGMNRVEIGAEWEEFGWRPSRWCNFAAVGVVSMGGHRGVCSRWPRNRSRGRCACLWPSAAYRTEASGGFYCGSRARDCAGGISQCAARDRP